MANLEQIKDQLEWGKENLDSPQDNLSLEDVEWLIEHAEKVDELQKENENLKQYKKVLMEASIHGTQLIIKYEDALREISIYEGDFYGNDMALIAKKALKNE
jgi:DNA-binding transcriptional MerR regulator